MPFTTFALIKISLVTVLVLLALFAFLMTRQLKLLKSFLRTRFGFLLEFFALLYLGVVFGVLLLAVLTL